MIALSVIIVNYNTKDLLKKCLMSLNRETIKISPEEIEVIVVDNGSTDGSIEMVKTDFSYASVLSNFRNEGYGKANNQGIKLAKGETILLLNSDIEVIDDGVGKLLSDYHSLKSPIFIGGKLLGIDNKSQASCGLFYSLPVTFLMLFLKGDILGLTRFSPSRIKEVDWVSGACLMGKKEYFKKVGLFDENIFMYMDEIDFLYRAKKMGYRIFFTPNSQFIHMGCGSSDGQTQPVVNIYKGLLYFYQKHKTPLQHKILQFMLQLKALLSVTIGKLSNNSYLKTTYGQALKLVR